MSKCELSNTTEVAVKLTRSLNWVVREPKSTALDIESKARLYSVRPHSTEVPAGVYFIAEGMVKFEVVNEYRLAQSISTVPGSVMRSLMCRRFRNPTAEPTREEWRK